MKLGVFLVSTPEYDTYRAMEVCGEIGYQGVELRVTNDKGDRNNPTFWSGNRTSLTPREVIEQGDKLREKARACNLQIPSLGSYISCWDLDRVELNMQAAQAIGAQALRVGPGGYDPDGGSYMSQAAACRKQYEKVAKLSQRYKVRALIETHMNQLCPSVAKARQILDGLPVKEAGIMWDPANQVLEGSETPAMALDIAEQYLGEVHAKNNRFEIKALANGHLRWRSQACGLREGIVQWPLVIQELKKINYSGWIIFEDFSTSLPLRERLEDNYAFFSDLLTP